MEYVTLCIGNTVPRWYENPWSRHGQNYPPISNCQVDDVDGEHTCSGTWRILHGPKTTPANSIRTQLSAGWSMPHDINPSFPWWLNSENKHGGLEYIRRGDILSVTLSMIYKRKEHSWWSLITVTAKLRVLPIYRLQTAGRISGSLTAKWLEEWNLIHPNKHPPIETGFQRIWNTCSR